MLRLLVALTLIAGAALPGAAAAATVSGSLDLSSGSPPLVQGLGYDAAEAPLLGGAAVSGRLGLEIPIRNSATYYFPVTLSRVAAPAGTIPAPPGCGFGTVPGAQAVAIADARALMQLEQVSLDVVRGRGSAVVGLARTGDGALEFGEYAAPGRIAVTTTGCTDAGTGEPVAGPDGGPFAATEELRAVGVGGDWFMGRWAAESLAREEVRLRLRDGAWQGTLAKDEEDAGQYGPATGVRLQIALRGTPASLHAHCRVPASLMFPGLRVRSRAGAFRVLRRAGFTKPRFAGRRRGASTALRGRYAVKDASSSSLPCGFPLKFVALTR